MTVQELIELLEELPPELEVLIASDEEGNSFHALSGEISEGCAEPDGHEYTFHAEEYYEDPADQYPGTNAIVLWP